MAFFFGKKNKDSENTEEAKKPEGSWFSRHFFSEKTEEQPEGTPAEEASASAETAAPENTEEAASENSSEPGPAAESAPSPEPAAAAPAPAPEPVRPAAPEPEKTSWFSRLRKGLEKTRVNLYGLFSGGVIDEDFLESLQDALIASDTGLPASEKVIGELRTAIKLKGLKTQDEVREELIRIITELLKPAECPLDIERTKPLVIMMAGVNGAGKTTSIGKIAKWLAANNKSVLLAAGDTFRAAAREQLEVWGSRNNIHVVSQTGADPAAVIFDAVSSAKARGMDIVLADTAGRLPTQSHLMDELSRIRRSQAKALPGAPHEVILVIDGTNGQNALMQVRQFDAAAGLTGLIVTKLDGTAKGGVLLAITEERRNSPLPIYFIGVGEKIDDLQPFKAEEFARALVGEDQTSA